jgi:DNA-binding transcriptional MerR regulator
VISVAQAAEAVGLSTHTLRWYEQEGIISPVERDAAGRRRYSPKDVKALTLVSKLRDTGMSVADMRRYAELVRLGPHTRRERRELLEAHRARVLDRIAALQRDLMTVNHKIDMYIAKEKDQACSNDR